MRDNPLLESSPDAVSFERVLFAVKLTWSSSGPMLCWPLLLLPVLFHPGWLGTLLILSGYEIWLSGWIAFSAYATAHVERFVGGVLALLASVFASRKYEHALVSQHALGHVQPKPLSLFSVNAVASRIEFART